jgi:phosphoenolpyruvate synthase/pyruvate phosphate dikinase
LSASGINADGILKKEQQQLLSAKTKQQGLYKKYNISKQYRELFEVAGDFALSKLVRRHAQLFCLYKMHASLLPEIAKRLNRTRYQVQFMLYDEIRKALIDEKVLSKKDLQNRFKECVLYTEKGFEAIYTGSTLKKLTKNIGRVFDKNQKELVGQTAQPGYAKGIVKIILRAKDISKMNKGDILVSIATDPDIVPAMKMAGAIVTEQGGITSHAAIVSRELGIPCVIGTKIATKIFKDGDLVEVDANKGIVKKLN